MQLLHLNSHTVNRNTMGRLFELCFTTTSITALGVNILITNIRAIIQLIVDHHIKYFFTYNVAKYSPVTHYLNDNKNKLLH